MRSNSFYKLNEKQIKKLGQEGVPVKKVSMYQLKDIDNSDGYKFIENHDLYLLNWRGSDIKEEVYLRKLLGISYISMSSDSGVVCNNTIWFYSSSENNTKENALKLILDKQLSDLDLFKTRIKRCKSKIDYLNKLMQN